MPWSTQVAPGDCQVGVGLQILHCVWFPDPRFDLPIFGADVVAGPAGISAAIVDLSPVGEALPERLVSSLSGLSRPRFRQERALPGWGTIFSPCVFIRPDGADEERFFQCLQNYLDVLSSAVVQAEGEQANSLESLKRYQGQLNYCIQQKRNDKTRRVLEKAFNVEWAERYITELLFDEPSHPGLSIA